MCYTIIMLERRPLQPAAVASLPYMFFPCQFLEKSAAARVSRIGLFDQKLKVLMVEQFFLKKLARKKHIWSLLLLLCNTALLMVSNKIPLREKYYCIFRVTVLLRMTKKSTKVDFSAISFKKSYPNLKVDTFK